ncbi:hypothetical protein R3X27_24235, partial [Tropicimonas sp. TH_r6]
TFDTTSEEPIETFVATTEEPVETFDTTSEEPIEDFESAYEEAVPSDTMAEPFTETASDESLPRVEDHLQDPEMLEVHPEPVAPVLVLADENRQDLVTDELNADTIEPAQASDEDAQEHEQSDAPRGRVIRVRKASLMSSLRAALSKEDTAEPQEAETEATSQDTFEEPEQAEEAQDFEEVASSLIEPATADAETMDTIAAMTDSVEPVDAQTTSSLPPDEEADLLRELEAVQREMAADAAEVAALETESHDAALRSLVEPEMTATTNDVEEELSSLAFASHGSFVEPVTEIAFEDPEVTAVEESTPVEAEQVAATLETEAETETVSEALETVSDIPDTDALEPAETVEPVVSTDVPEMDFVEDVVARVARESEQEARAEAAAERRALVLGEEQETVTNVSRLMEEADSKLAGPEIRRRRSAIEHLKAAVAATRAEGPRLPNGPEEARPYQDDLRKVVSTPPVSSFAEENTPETDADQVVHVAEIPSPDATSFETSEASTPDAAPESTEGVPVRPRRPILSGSRPRESRPVAATERPRVAPLMLVSEQRVDETNETASEAPVQPRPVRPRRVTTGRMVSPSETSVLSEMVTEAEKAVAAVPEIVEEAPRSMVSTDQEAAGIFAESTTFDEFSERMGVQGLEDLLECAAAYTSYVQGQPHFSHPEIMDVVRQAEGQEELRREDSLRTFGQLLRQGKIRKLDRGQFTLSQTSRYMPEERRATL